MIAQLKGLRRFLAAVILVGLFSGCVEPIEIQTGSYENALMIEGTITNELSHQEIRTYELVESGQSQERNVIVQVIGNSKSGCLDYTKYGSNVVPDFWEE